MFVQNLVNVARMIFPPMPEPAPRRYTPIPKSKKTEHNIERKRAAAQSRKRNR